MKINFEKTSRGHHRVIVSEVRKTVKGNEYDHIVDIAEAASRKTLKNWLAAQGYQS